MAGGHQRLLDLGDSMRRVHRDTSATAGTVRTIEKRVAREQAAQIRAIRTSLGELRHEVRAWREQTTLQLQSLRGPVPSAAVPGAVRPAHAGAALPLSVEGPGPGWAGVADGGVHPDPDGREWRLLDACPCCGGRARSLVLEWNKLVLLDAAPDASSARYDYSLCHRCGVVYAARRPCGGRYRFLLEHFGEVTGKQGGRVEIKNPILNPYALSPEDESRLARMASSGVFVSDHLELGKRDYLEGLAKDRFEMAVHVDLLANLVPLSRARVLELRPRTGAIAESLRRLFRADVSVVPMWESQRVLLKAVYGFASHGLVDFDQFVSPVEGPFDLIVCNHMLTHMLRPAEFLEELRSRLTADGYVYFYNEPEDTEYMGAGQSMIAHFNPLHVQGFDRRSLVRLLSANGFETVFVKARGQNHLCLARRRDAVDWTPMEVGERLAREAGLQAARDRAILKVPAAVRGRVAEVWRDAVQRRLAAGDLDFDDRGRLRFVSVDRRGRPRPRTDS
jgi:SAM-dependent methyltransferase